MRLKKRLTGRAFAEGLVSKIGRDVYDQWPDIQNQVRKGLQHIDRPSDLSLPEAYAPYVIVAAVVADLQAARNLRDQLEFMVLRKHVLERLGEALNKDNATDLFALFQNAWDEAIDRGESPVTYGLASILYDCLELPYGKHESGGSYQASRVLLVLSEIVASAIGFTKFALDNFRVNAD